ncbi:GtrA family protein [Patescibacteria group bacterium]|nr:GtrA family protein [Patescibacteria group bacterium]
MLRKIDFVISIIISFLTAVYFSFLFYNLYPYIWGLLLIFPVLGALGIWVAYLISKKFLFIYQFAKFALIGTMTALVDLAILNLLIFAFGIAVGISFTIFKIVSFLIAFSTKYFGDKFWAFTDDKMIGIGKQIGMFFGVTLIGLLINVVVASLMVNWLGPQFGLSSRVWANIAGITASLTTIIWNFPAYKYLVFKK